LHNFEPKKIIAVGLQARHLPVPTTYDPSEDPPGSIDPLGTLGGAERIAEVLFPGLTARMWRPRLLTFAAMASVVAERLPPQAQGVQENAWQAARLGFERLFVSAVVRQQLSQPAERGRATRRLPGSSLARRALRAGDEPLGRSNFLKGQAVNGPYGVLARLARHLNIVDEDDRLGRSGEELLLAWAVDEGLPGLLDEDKGGSPGRQWLDRFVQTTASHVAEARWMRPGWSGWQDLAGRLRPDKVGREERRVLRNLLNGDAIRARCLELLCEPQVVSLFRSARDSGGRGNQDRTVLLEGILPSLFVGEHKEDRVIELTVHLADAYEEVASLLEAAFNGLLWGLTHRGGQAEPAELEADVHLLPVFRSICQQLPPSARRLQYLVVKIPSVPQVQDLNPIPPLDGLASQALSAAESPARLIETVISRHRDVQNPKRKGMWIELGERWTLLPGFGWAADAPPKPEVVYLHTFRVPNAYSFLGELGLAGMEVPDGEA